MSSERDFALVSFAGPILNQHRCNVSRLLGCLRSVNKNQSCRWGRKSKGWKIFDGCTCKTANFRCSEIHTSAYLSEKHIFIGFQFPRQSQPPRLSDSGFSSLNQCLHHNHVCSNFGTANCRPMCNNSDSRLLPTD